jgi:hypothetical protein
VADSFWAIPDAAAIRTPLSILREQASALTQQTQGVLVGEAATKSKGDDLVVSLDIVVPGLNDYRYRVLMYEQPLEMYPGSFRAPVDALSKTIADETSFVAAVKAALSSQKVKNALTSLLAQVSGA